MAAMRPLKSFYLLGFSPFLLTFACRTTSPFLHVDSQQCSLYSTSALSETYSYRIAASFSPKGGRFNPKKDLFSFNRDQGTDHTAPSTSPRKRPNSGQDAFFVSAVGKSDNVAFGVADGVGGWSDSGIDSADFSHGLCERMADIAIDTGTHHEQKLMARDLLQKAYSALVEEKNIRGGGSTACIAVGNSDGALQVAKYVAGMWLLRSYY